MQFCKCLYLGNFFLIYLNTKLLPIFWFHFVTKKVSFWLIAPLSPIHSKFKKRHLAILERNVRLMHIIGNAILKDLIQMHFYLLINQLIQNQSWNFNIIYLCALHGFWRYSSKSAIYIGNPIFTPILFDLTHPKLTSLSIHLHLVINLHNLSYK